MTIQLPHLISEEKQMALSLRPVKAAPHQALVDCRHVCGCPAAVAAAARLLRAVAEAPALQQHASCAACKLAAAKEQATT